MGMAWNAVCWAGSLKKAARVVPAASSPCVLVTPISSVIPQGIAATCPNVSDWWMGRVTQTPGHHGLERGQTNCLRSRGSLVGSYHVCVHGIAAQEKRRYAVATGRTHASFLCSGNQRRARRCALQGLPSRPCPGPPRLFSVWPEQKREETPGR